MTKFSIQRSNSHRQRYREIARVFIRYGFGDLVPHPRVRVATRWPLGRLECRGECVHIRARPGGAFEAGAGRVGANLCEARPGSIHPPRFAAPSLHRRAEQAAGCGAARALGGHPGRDHPELGRPPEEVFASIDPNRSAAASLGQVHAATLADGTEVVIKVQRPNIQPTIATDLEILQALAAAAQRTPEGQIMTSSPMADEFAYTLNNELDYRLEGRNADRFRANFADEPLLHVPHVYWEYTTARVLVLERIHGIKIDDVAALDAAGYDRHQVAVNCRSHDRQRSAGRWLFPRRCSSR